MGFVVIYSIGQHYHFQVDISVGPCQVLRSKS